MNPSRSTAARFHLRDGRPLVFHTIPRSVFRRHMGEIALALMLAVVGLIAATLLAKGRPDSPRPPRALATSR